jgi:orotate phosphoribosyltransferase
MAASFEGQGMGTERARLLSLLVTHAYAYKPEGFRLASGKISDEYLDCKMALSQPDALQPLGDLFLSHVDPGAVAIGGLTMGADPIAVNTSRSSAHVGRNLRWFAVRKDAKEYGKKKAIEGNVSAGESVVVVDDVVTTGGSTIQAIEKCREHGLRVVQVLVLVDREENDGLEKIREAAGPGVSVLAMFTKSEVRQAWASHSKAIRE